jgi:MFS superfamily sulfate permease-like transporter
LGDGLDVRTMFGFLVGVVVGMILMCIVFSFMSQFTFQPAAATTYANLEEWEVIRDPVTGRTRGIRVIRRATVSNG